MAIPAATRLDSNHHTFLQAVMKRGPLSEKATMAMYKALVNSTTGEGFVPFLLAINQELGFVQMEVKKVMNQYDGKEFYGIINTLPSKEAKLGTQLSQAQILLFTAMMQAIAQNHTASGVITELDAMHLKLEPQVDSSTQDGNTQAQAQAQTGPIKMSMQAREEAIALLVAEQLLCRADGGGLGLGVKAFLELRSLFRNLGVPFCGICNEAAIKAQLCRTENCPQRVHTYCVNRGSQSRNQRLKCAGCKAVWAQPVEEDRAGTQETQEGEDEGEDYTVPIATQETAQTSSLPRSGRRKRSAAVLDDEEEEEQPVEVNGHDAENEVRSARSTRSSSRSGR